MEYEYLYLDRELTIDKVMAKTRRKRVAVYQLTPAIKDSGVNFIRVYQTTDIKSTKKISR